MTTGLLITSLSFFYSCKNPTNTIPSIQVNELYIYHNGIDTLIKNYDHYSFMKPLIDEAGFHFKDTSMKWFPMPNESSQFLYYQVINNQYIYLAGSIFYDSNIVDKFSSGERISDQFQRIINSPTNQHTYSTIEKITNKPESIVYTYHFYNDSLNIKISFSNSGNFIDSKMAYKYYKNQ